MVLTVPEAARFLRVSEDVVYRLCASGEIPARRAAEGLSRRAAAVALGVGDGSWARWIGRGGWLAS